MKTNKSLSKRLRITPSGKVLSRKAGKGHFNAKASRNKQLAGNRMQDFKHNRKELTRLLPGKRIK
jgi:ribosomal protein L35